MKTRLRLSVWLLFILAALFLGCVITQELTRDANGQITHTIYDGTLVLASLSLLACLCVACCFHKRWLSLHGVGFLVCHLALVLFLASAFVWFVWGVQETVTLPEGGSASGGEQIPFEMSCTDFTVEYRHAVTYSYALPEGDSYEKKGTATLVLLEKDGVFTPEAETLSCGGKKIPVSKLFNEEGRLTDQLLYEEMLLTPTDETQSVKQYYADITYSDGGSDRLSVNRPATHNGWKIYLTSYRASENGVSVTLQAKRDYADSFAPAGLILCPVGTFLLCLRPRRRREEAAS